MKLYYERVKLILYLIKYCDKKERKRKSYIILRSKRLRLGWQSLSSVVVIFYTKKKKYQIFNSLFFRDKSILLIYSFDFL